MRPRVRRRYVLPLSFLVLPPLFWSLVLALTPTEWARARIVACLSETTGRPATLESLRIGTLGGIHLSGLTVGAPGGGVPWLKVASARINVSLLQLLVGQVEPTAVQVDGMSLRVLRRKDGTLELADFLHCRQPQTAGTSGEVSPAAAVEVQIRNSEIAIIDEPSGTKLELTEVEGDASTEGRLASLRDLHGLVNGGRFELIASLDRGAAEPAFEGTLKTFGVELGAGTSILAHVVPVLACQPGQGAVEGRMDGSLYLRGAGASRGALRRSLVGQGTISLDPVELQRSQLLADLAHLVELRGDNQSASLKSNFAIQQGRITTNDLTILIDEIPIVLTGWTDFDGRLDYRVRSESLADRLPGQAREFLSDMAIKPENLTDLRLEGTLEDMEITSPARATNLLGADQRGGRRTFDRGRARDLGRRLRERIFR